MRDIDFENLLPYPMARRKKSSLAEDLIEVVSLVPWWLGLAIGAVSYFLLHWLAQPPLEPVVVTSVAGLGDVVKSELPRVLAQLGQYVVPLLCFIGAAISAVRGKRRAALFDSIAQAGSAHAINAMSWQEFEQLIGEWFRRQGYAITEVGGAGPDGGVDLVLRKNGEKFLVQCKQWRSTKVGVGVVRELFGVMAAERVAGGFVVTSGAFTDDAKEFAKGRNVELLDGAMLTRGLKAASHMRPHVAQDREAVPTTAQSATRQCPACGSQMLLRVAKRGANAGQEFLGCSGYPRCKTTLPAPKR